MRAHPTSGIIRHDRTWDNILRALQGGSLYWVVPFVIRTNPEF